MVIPHSGGYPHAKFEGNLLPGGDDELNSRRRRIWSGIEIGVGM